MEVRKKIAPMSIFLGYIIIYSIIFLPSINKWDIKQAEEIELIYRINGLYKTERLSYPLNFPIEINLSINNCDIYRYISFTIGLLSLFIIYFSVYNLTRSTWISLATIIFTSLTATFIVFSRRFMVDILELLSVSLVILFSGLINAKKRFYFLLVLSITILLFILSLVYSAIYLSFLSLVVSIIILNKSKEIRKVAIILFLIFSLIMYHYISNFLSYEISQRSHMAGSSAVLINIKKPKIFIDSLTRSIFAHSFDIQTNISKYITISLLLYTIYYIYKYGAPNNKFGFLFSYYTINMITMIISPFPLMNPAYFLQNMPILFLLIFLFIKRSSISYKVLVVIFVVLFMKTTIEVVKISTNDVTGIVNAELNHSICLMDIQSFLKLYCSGIKKLRAKNILFDEYSKQYVHAIYGNYEMHDYLKSKDIRILYYGDFKIDKNCDLNNNNTVLFIILDGISYKDHLINKIKEKVNIYCYYSNEYYICSSIKSNNITKI